MAVNRHKLFLAAVITASTAGMVVLWLRAFYPPPHDVVSLESPDKRYRVVVQEQEPGGMMESPYEYRFRVYDNQRGVELAGEAKSISFGTRVNETKQLHPEWKADSSAVMVGDFTGTINAGRQEWK